VAILRVAVIVAAVAGLSYAIISAVVTGPPVVSDPLSTTATLLVPPGNFTFLGGLITGEDFVVGNFTVVNPIGTLVGFSVYNSTEFSVLVQHLPATPSLFLSPQTSGRIVFAAPYTDTFYLVWSNPYAPVTGLSVSVYVTTTYETNVGSGFG